MPFFSFVIPCSISNIIPLKFFERVFCVLNYLIRNDNNGGGSTITFVQPFSKPSINMASLSVLPKRCVLLCASHQEEQEAEEEANYLVNLCSFLAFRPLSSSHRSWLSGNFPTLLSFLSRFLLCTLISCGVVSAHPRHFVILRRNPHFKDFLVLCFGFGTSTYTRQWRRPNAEELEIYAWSSRGGRGMNLHL